MKSRIATLALLVTLATSSSLLAGEPWSKAIGGYWAKLAAPRIPDCLTYCCDTYDRKCLPATKPVSHFTCDLYDRKHLPCVKPVDCFTCDIYCRSTTGY